MQKCKQKSVTQKSSFIYFAKSPYSNESAYVGNVKLGGQITSCGNYNTTMLESEADEKSFGHVTHQNRTVIDMYQTHRRTNIFGNDAMSSPRV